MNKISILAIIIGIVVVGIIAAGGIGSDPSTPDVQNPSSSEVIIEEDESGTKHFSVTMSEEFGLSATP